MAQQQHRFPQNSDHVSAFVAAPTLPQPAIAPTAPDSRGDIIDAIRNAAQAFTQRFQRVEPVKPPEYTSVYAVLRNFTPESTVAHLRNGTADSQIPAQEYLLKYLRQHRQLKLKPINQRVLQIDIPRWEDGVAIRRRLSTFHERAIVHIRDVPVRPRHLAPQGMKATSRM